jgi:nitrogen regulatory protein PII 2
MKEVMAIVRFNKMNITKRALADAGFYSMTTLKIMGRGRIAADYPPLQGTGEGHKDAASGTGTALSLAPKRLITVVVPDEQVKAAVEAIIEVNRTGHPGDGKIFVLPVLDAVRVRTGETGEDAIDMAVLI